MLEKEDFARIEELLTSIRQINQKIEIKSEEQGISQKDKIISELSGELESRKDLVRKFHFLFQLVGKRMGSLQETQNKLRVNKTRVATLESKLNIRGKEILKLQDALERGVGEISLLKNSLENEKEKSRSLTITLKKVTARREQTKEEHNRLAFLVKKQMSIMGHLRSQVKEREHRIKGVMEDVLQKEKSLQANADNIVVLKKEIFLSHRLLGKSMENDESLQKLSSQLKERPESILKGKVDGKKLLFIFKELSRELKKKEEELFDKQGRISSRDKKLLALVVESDAFKERLHHVEETNKRLLKMNFDIGTKLEFLKRDLEKEKKSSLDKESNYEKILGRTRKEYEEREKNNIRKGVEEKIRIRASSLRSEPNKGELMASKEENPAEKPKHAHFVIAEKSAVKTISMPEERPLITRKTEATKEDILPLIKIALEHGESKERVKESLINSGHDIVIVESALSQF